VSTKMVDLYRKFLIEPTADRYRAALLAMANHSGDGVRSLLVLEQAHREGRFETIQSLVRQWARHFALSPRFHRLAAIAALELGDQEDAELERFTANACLEGIVASGDGSDARPFLISDRADAQEVLAKLNLKSLRQSLIENDGILCDVFEVRASAKSTREIWFSCAYQPSINRSPARQPKNMPTKRSRRVKV
jgi:hypothetical protein